MNIPLAELAAPAFSEAALHINAAAEITIRLVTLRSPLLEPSCLHLEVVLQNDFDPPRIQDAERLLPRPE